jgi:hypothetical protein
MKPLVLMSSETFTVSDVGTYVHEGILGYHEGTKVTTLTGVRYQIK